MPRRNIGSAPKLMVRLVTALTIGHLIQIGGKAAPLLLKYTILRALLPPRPDAENGWNRAFVEGQ